MKQMFWKEWREQFKVALIGLAIFSLILLQAVKSGMSYLSSLNHSYETSIYTDGLQPLVSNELLGESAIFCGLFGLALGWLQIFAENHRDLRAFLLHRPVDRLRLLHGKLLSGLALYSVAVGLPCAGLLVYVLIPGHVPAPFEWAMVGPMTNVYLLGLVGYGAGLLTCLRPARWYASRIFGLGPAIVAAIAVFACPAYWQALGVLVVAGLVLYLAIRGAWQTGGVFPDQKWTAKVALSITCAAAGVLVSAVVMAAIVALLRNPSAFPYSYYAVGRDGLVYRVTGQQPIVDLNGQILLDKKTGKPLRIQDFRGQSAEVRGTDVTFASPGVAEPPNRTHYISSLHYFVPWRLQEKALWYWTRQGQLQGYDGITRQSLGTLTPPAPESRFRGPDEYYQPYFEPFQQPHVLRSTNALYWVDLEARTVKLFFTTMNQEEIGGFSQDSAGGRMLVVTRDTIRLLNSKGDVELAIPHEPAWPDYGAINLYRLADTNGFAVQFFPDYWRNQQSGGKLSSLIKWVREDGQIARTQVLPNLPEDTGQDLVGNVCSLVFPPALRLPTERITEHDYQPNVWDALSVIPALISVLAGWLMGRRYHFSGRDQAAWAGFHLIFGIPGLIAFFSVQEWPAKEPCPHCQKLRMVNREQCEYCDGEFAPPARNGTEIFEPVAVKALN